MPKPEVEVEDILRDIRRRVLNENGAMDEDPPHVPMVRDRQTDASDIRIETYLSAIDRLRGNLPPVRSDRRGVIAKIELWIKGRIGRATRWFVFDQVDFNSTVYQVLGELRAAQVRQERIISAFQATTRLEASERALEQRTINEEQRIVNEDLRAFQEEQRVSDEEVRLLLEELRRQINESAVTIDRMRRNFEHRLGEIEHRGS